jgi:protein-tyrosine phosphatase
MIAAGNPRRKMLGSTSLSGFIDLHCHWLPGVDDGARTLPEGLEMLERLAQLGFEHVVATPHLRPGLFSGTPENLRAAFRATKPSLPSRGVPQVSLGSEHFFDAVVVDWIRSGQGLPYGSELELQASEARSSTGRKAVLVEFSDLRPLSAVEELLYQLQRAQFLPVIAHPERYPAVWDDPHVAERLQERGAVLLLDLAAVRGKYGRRSQETAIKLLDLEAYEAACTDSHRPADVDIAGAAIDWISSRYGFDEVDLLLSETPRRLLFGLPA